MQGCTIIFKFSRFCAFVIFFATSFIAESTFAQSGAAIPTQGSGIGAAPGGGDPNQPMIPNGKKEESGLFDQASPYLEYGDFNMTEEENNDAVYFQYGRFFGISLGMGYQTATGNRGKLYQAAIPRLDIRLHYWFDFNFAMDIGVFFATHNYEYGSTTYQNKLLGYGLHLKYYFDVKDASAALTFSNPFIEAGLGQWSMSETASSRSAPDVDSTLSADFGGGLEFPVVHKKTYIIVEALYHSQSFADSASKAFINTVPDLNGGFFTLMIHAMFVW